MQRAFVRGLVAAIVAASILQLAAGCAARPPAEQYLDMRTGATIFRVRKPLSLSRSLASDADIETDYVVIAPFEVNRMGDYRLYLWVAFLSLEHTRDGAIDALNSIELTLDDQVYKLVMVTEEGRKLGIGEPVYPSPASWAKIVYFPITYDQVGELIKSSTLALGTGGSSVAYERHEEQADVMQSFSELQRLSAR